MSRGGKNVFNTQPSVKVPRSKFPVFGRTLTAFGTSFIYPVFCEEILPGDTWSLNLKAFIRMTNLKYPLMDNVYFYLHCFYVPLRLIWDDEEPFFGYKKNKDSSIDYLVPCVNSGTEGFAEESLFDYLGLPTKVPNLNIPCALYARAYELIWNDWFRNEVLEDEVEIPMGSGTDDLTAYVLQKRSKKADYFTTALESPTRGPEIIVPLGSSAPVTAGEPHEFVNQITNKHVTFAKNPGQPFDTAEVASLGLVDSSMCVQPAAGFNISQRNIKFDNLYADLTQAQSAGLGELLQAMALYNFYYRSNVSGTRYTEYLQGHFGVNSGDSRLQRPEFLSSGRFQFSINPVVQTSGTGTTGSQTPQGNLTANGVGAGSFKFTHSFTEHGIFMVLLSTRTDLTYQQGIPRKFLHTTKNTFYTPELACLPEQVIENREIYAQGTEADTEPFGYQERWSELRYLTSQVTGKMRSNSAQSLDFAHLGLDFQSLPLLDGNFIKEDPPLNRAVAIDVKEEPPFIGDFYCVGDLIRCMPVYSIPGFATHL